MKFATREPFEDYKCDSIIEVSLDFLIERTQTIIILKFPNDPDIKVTIDTMLTVSEIERLANRIVSDYFFVKHGYFSKPIAFKEGD